MRCNARPSATAACAVLVLVLLGNTVSGWLMAWAGVSYDSWLYYLLSTLLQWIVSALPVFVYYGRIAPGRASALRLNRLDPLCAVLTALSAAVGVLALNYVALYWTVFLRLLGLSPLAGTPAPSSPAMLVCMLVSVVCTAGVVEELVFRGLLLPALEPLGERRAVAWSALLFMLMHLSVEVMPTHFLIGAVLALLALRTGSLYAPMLFHGVYNGVIVLLQYALRSQAAAEPTAAQALSLLPGALLMLWAWYGLLSLALRRGAQTSLCTLAHADGERFVRPRWYVAGAPGPAAGGRHVSGVCLHAAGRRAMITAILCAGKLREAFWREAAEEYIRRLKRFGPLEMLECPDLPEPRNASAADIARLVEAESAAMLRQLRPQDYVVALCVEARSLSSPALAERLARIEAGGARRLVFVLGGSNGLSPALLARANERLSFSPMTFPHQLARVMLLEQLYRCRKILAHEAYHK